MSITLVDRGDPDHTLNLNLWIWRTITATAARLDVLDADALAQLEPFCGGLDRPDARRLGAAFETQVLPGLGPDGRMLLDGAVTDTPDDGVFHREAGSHALNYAAPREALERFVRFCLACDGFDQ